MSTGNGEKNSKIDGNDFLNTANVFGSEKIKKKRISEFSEEDMKIINNIIAGGYKKGVNKIDTIKNKIKEKGGFDMENEVMTMFIVSIISYYLNNNFYDKVDVFLKDLRLGNLDLLIQIINDLISKYKNTDKYCFIANHCQGILFYNNIYQKEKFINDGFLETVNIDSKLKLKNVINELTDLKNKIGDPYWFNYFNTLVSYTNYELVFLDENDKFLKEYISTLLKFILSIDIDLSEYSDVVKAVYMNNLSIIYQLTGNEVVKQKIDNIKNDYLSRENNGLKTFSQFYGGLKSGEEGLYDISYLGLILEKEKIGKYSLSYILANYSPIITIKNFSALFYSYYKNLNEEYLKQQEEKIYIKINSLQDVIFYDLIDRLDSIVGFNYELVNYFIKVFLIQYLGLNVNEVNLSYKIGIKTKLNKRIKLIGFNVNDTKKYDFSVNLKFNFKGFKIPLTITLNGNVDEKIIKNKFKLYQTKFEVFFKIVIEKLLNLNHFLNVIDHKITIINKKHLETVQHMSRVGQLLGDIYDEIQNSKLKGQIDLIKQTLPISDKSFFSLLGYLHDIGKYDNLDIMEIYESINIRIDSYKFFLQFLMYIVYEKDIDEKDIDEKDIDEKDIDEKDINESVINLNVGKIIKIVEGNSLIINMINNLFTKIKSFNISFLMGNNLFVYNLINIAISISELIKENGYSVSLINSKYKDKILTSIKQKFGEYIDYDGNIDDLFLGVIIVFEIFNKKLLKEITHPHIEYGLQFFRFFPEFSYLSSVLYHHKDYPSIETIKKYDGFKGLTKFSKIIGENNKYLKGGESYILAEKKDFFMLATYVTDIMDALLGKRNYQLNININETNSGKYLSPGFINYLNKVFSGEDLSDKNKTFDKVLKILDTEFGNNPYYPEIKSILEEKREKIIAMYQNI